MRASKEIENCDKNIEFKSRVQKRERGKKKGSKKK
jgi:hypothetical protein